MTTQVADSTQACVEALTSQGFNFFTGVADSLVASLILALEREDPAYIPAVREDAAIGLASGAFLSGRRPVVLMQNSGLGYCLNALTSLNLIYKIPLLLIVGWRGYLGKDAPEHLVMGEQCENLLKTIGIPVLVPSQEEVAGAITKANILMEKERIPVAILIRPGIFS